MNREIDEHDEDEGELSADDIRRMRARLEEERNQVILRMKAHIGDALEEETKLPDEVDQANGAQSQAFLLRLGDKERKLLTLIDRALGKIENGTFGYCEGTGEPIPLKRLELRPWARYSVDYKQVLEKERALHVEDEE